jgi:hypothetical protein
MNINATLMGGERPRSFCLSGRIGQTLNHIHRAGRTGITSHEWPAMRLSAYVHSLRKMGFKIATERELHGGDYPGHHARYRLESVVTVSENQQ